MVAPRLPATLACFALWFVWHTDTFALESTFQCQSVRRPSPQTLQSVGELTLEMGGHSVENHWTLMSLALYLPRNKGAMLPESGVFMARVKERLGIREQGRRGVQVQLKLGHGTCLYESAQVPDFNFPVYTCPWDPGSN